MVGGSGRVVYDYDGRINFISGWHVRLPTLHTMHPYIRNFDIG
jgi:hypothetical protein